MIGLLTSEGLITWATAYVAAVANIKRITTDFFGQTNCRTCGHPRDRIGQDLCDECQRQADDALAARRWAGMTDRERAAMIRQAKP